MRHAGLGSSLLLVVLLIGCFGGLADDPVLQLSSAEALEEGRKLMAEGKFQRARRYFVHAFEVEPNSVTGREGLLLAADSLFKAGGESNLIKAESRYRDFVNRFPTSEHAAYAQFQIGLSLARRIVKPDRDQSVAKQALAALQDVERFYPTSPYAQRAAEEIRRLRGHLAEHDFLVGRFYMRYGLPPSAIGRFEYILENYPEYGERDKVLYYLCKIYLDREAAGDDRRAWEHCTKLEDQFPESEYVEKIPEDLPRMFEESDDEEEGDTGPLLSDDGV